MSPEKKHPQHTKLLEDLDSGEFSFVDLGCGSGESISHCEKQFGLGKGIGFDISPRKIEAAISNGFPAILADVTNEQTEGRETIKSGCVRFCTMMDFLEHLPDESYATKILKRVGNIARDFLFIRHPNFEDIEYLSNLGLKLGWTHWKGHTNMMRMDDYHRIFSEIGFNDYCIIPRKQILSSAHPAVVPLSAPIDTVQYDPETHGVKNLVYFSRPIWTQFDIYVRLNKNLPIETWEQILDSSDSESLLKKEKSLHSKELKKRRSIEESLKTEIEKNRVILQNLNDPALKLR